MGLRRNKKAEEPENLERWLISYSDFMTLLVAFFVVMYAISSVNEGKYRVLSQTLLNVFTHAPTSAHPIRLSKHSALKPPVHPVHVAPQVPRVISKPMSFQGSASLEPVMESIRRSLSSLIASGKVKVRRTPRGVVVRLNSDLLFPSGSDVMTAQAVPILSRLGLILQTIPYRVEVQGYTDPRPIHTERFPNNWSLSVARAVTVVRLFQVLGVGPGRMAASGYGKYHPVATNATAAGRAKNRRVDVVILAKRGSHRGALGLNPSDFSAGAP